MKGAKLNIRTILIALMFVVLEAVVGHLVDAQLDEAGTPSAEEGHVARDGAFDVTVRRSVAPAEHGITDRVIFQVIVVNRDDRATAAHPSFILFAGDHSFSPTRVGGRAFRIPILQQRLSRGTVTFRIPRGVVPDRVEADLDGDGDAVVIELGPPKGPP